MQGRTTRAEFFRFIIGGVVNTVLTYGLFLVLGTFVHHAIAYTIAYLAGIALAYALAATFVFRSGFDVRAALRFPLVYAIQYLYGLTLLLVLVDYLQVPQQFAMLAVIATSFPLTFVLTKSLLATNPRRPFG